MKPRLIFSFLCLFSLFSYAQVENKLKDARNQKIETTKLEIEKADSDSLRLKLKVKLAGQLAYFDGAIAKEIYLDVHQTIKDKGYNSDYYKEMEAELLYSMSSVSPRLCEVCNFVATTVSRYCKFS